MRTDWMRLGLLVAVALLGTGASPEGVEQARVWQHKGDLARAGGLDEIAYVAYERVYDTFPGTRHGRLAAGRMRQLRARLSWPEQAPQSENASGWVSELMDFFIWP